MQRGRHRWNCRDVPWRRMSQEPERPPDSASLPTALPGVHSEVDDALAVAAASTAAAKSEPAESGESAASVDTLDGEPGIVDRFLDSAGAATSKISDAAATGGRATAQTVASTAKTVAGALSSAGSTTKQAVGTGAEKTAEAARRWAASVVGAAQGLLASDLSDAFNDLTQAVVDGSATIYDKAMDAEYLETHIGGGLHRLFDGGHTISGAWDAARDASLRGCRRRLQGCCRLGCEHGRRRTRGSRRRSCRRGSSRRPQRSCARACGDQERPVRSSAGVRQARRGQGRRAGRRMGQ